MCGLTKPVIWIEEQGDAPFFAYIATNAPHTPLWVPDEYRQPYLDQVAYNVASFYGMIANIDENMGKLDTFLRKTGLRDNTILIFMTDNGTANGETVYNAGMRGKKTTLYEGGHRVPFFIRWPEGQLGDPRDIPEPTHGTDVLPTLISLCGLDEPEGTACDGVSLTGLLHEREELKDRMLVVQYGHTVPTGNRTTRKGNAAVIWHRWRLIDDTELYHLDSDPGQEHNIADQHPRSRAKECGRITMCGGMNLAKISIFTSPFPSEQKRKNPRDCPVAIGWASIATIPEACADV